MHHRIICNLWPIMLILFSDHVSHTYALINGSFLSFLIIELWKYKADVWLCCWIIAIIKWKWRSFNGPFYSAIVFLNEHICETCKESIINLIWLYGSERAKEIKLLTKIGGLGLEKCGLRTNAFDGNIPFLLPVICKLCKL